MPVIDDPASSNDSPPAAASNVAAFRVDVDSCGDLSVPPFPPPPAPAVLREGRLRLRLRLALIDVGVAIDDATTDE